MTEKWTNDDLSSMFKVNFLPGWNMPVWRSTMPKNSNEIDCLRAELEAVKADNAELEAMFKRQWECKRALNDLWRSEKPEERALTLNDATEISEWAVATITALKAQVEGARRPSIEVAFEANGGSMPLGRWHYVVTSKGELKPGDKLVLAKEDDDD